MRHIEALETTRGALLRADVDEPWCAVRPGMRAVVAARTGHRGAARRHCGRDVGHPQQGGHPAGSSAPRSGVRRSSRPERWRRTVSGSDVAALGRAHELFAGSAGEAVPEAPSPRYDGLLARSAALNDAGGQQLYRPAVDRSREALHSAAATDAAVTATMAEARRDHAVAHALTKSVLDEARADTAVPDNPIAQREAIRRRVARLQAQQAHVLAARRKAQRHRSRWRPLSYRMLSPRSRPCADCGCRRRTPAPASRSRGAVTVGPALCVGRNRPGPVRLFGVDPVVVCAGGNSFGPHHISADLRRNPGSALASPSRRPGFSHRGARATGDR